MAMFVDKVRIEFWKLEELNEKMTCVFLCLHGIMEKVTQNIL